MTTPAQLKTLSFICGFIARHRHAPSLSEIAKGIGIRSKGVVHRRLQALGRIAAGKPIEAMFGQDQRDLSTLYGPNRYALRVTGNSMVDIGILDGDTVIVEQRNIAEDGEIVVALIDSEETTLKRLKYRHDGNLALIAENTAMPAMIYAADRGRFQSIVTPIHKVQ